MRWNDPVILFYAWVGLLALLLMGNPPEYIIYLGLVSVPVVGVILVVTPMVGRWLTQKLARLMVRPVITEAVLERPSSASPSRLELRTRSSELDRLRRSASGIVLRCGPLARRAWSLIIRTLRRETGQSDRAPRQGVDAERLGPRPHS
jgi:hypothetical protein